MHLDNPFGHYHVVQVKDGRTNKNFNTFIVRCTWTNPFGHYHVVQVKDGRTIGEAVIVSTIEDHNTIGHIF